MGDFFTNAIDENGCVLIASGSTLVPQALDKPTSRPILIKQNSGPSLTGRDCASGTLAAASTPAASPLPTTPSSAPLPATSSTRPDSARLAFAALALVLAAAAVLAAWGRRLKARIY
jgi:hypothetical protein